MVFRKLQTRAEPDGPWQECGTIHTPHGLGQAEKLVETDPSRWRIVKWTEDVTDFINDILGVSPTMTATRTTITAIKAANKAAGHHFFSRSTMRFFNSRVERSVYQGPGGVYLITSEQFVPSSGRPDPRRYTVRQFHPETGDIATVGKFNRLDLDEARTEANRLAKGN